MIQELKKEVQRLKYKGHGFLGDLVGVEKTGREITSLEAEIELESPRIRPTATRYEGYGVVVSVDYGDGTKLSFGGQNGSDLWLREQDLLRGAFPNKNTMVRLDIYVANAKIADKYKVPRVFGDVVYQAVDYLVTRIHDKIIEK